jgi:hypothetical protein
VNDSNTGSLKKWLGISAVVALVAGIAAKLRGSSTAAGEHTVEAEHA